MRRITSKCLNTWKCVDSLCSGGGNLLWGVILLWGVKVALGRICSGENLLWGEFALGRCQLLWGVNVALGSQCCSGENLLWGVSQLI